MKNKKFLILCFIALGLFYVSFALADPVPYYPPGSEPPTPTFLETLYQGLPVFFIGLLFAIIIETIFGYFLFFRKNRKGILAILIANLISFPLFYLYYLFAGFMIEGGNVIQNLIFSCTIILIGELAVIIIEMFILKITLRKEITYKKAFIISLSLNLISLFLGFLFIVALETFLLKPY